MCYMCSQLRRILQTLRQHILKNWFVLAISTRFCTWTWEHFSLSWNRMTGNKFLWTISYLFILDLWRLSFSIWFDSSSYTVSLINRMALFHNLINNRKYQTYLIISSHSLLEGKWANIAQKSKDIKYI